MKDTQVGMGLGTSVGREPGSSDFGLILSAHPPPTMAIRQYCLLEIKKRFTNLLIMKMRGVCLGNYPGGTKKLHGAWWGDTHL